MKKTSCGGLLYTTWLQTGRLRVTGECKNAIEGHRNITANPPDLILLDREMPGTTGIELLKILPKQIPAIITTSKKEYGVQGFDRTNAMAYHTYYG